MEPEILTNSISMTKNTSFSRVRVGDVIVFREPRGDTIVHRVIRITPEGLVTKGDANAVDDAWRVTEDMYYATLVKSYNGSARVITFLFGTLVRPDLFRIAFVLIILLCVIVGFILILVTIYQFISINWYIKKRKGSATPELSGWFKHRLTEEELNNILDVTGLINKLRRIKLINELDSERKHAYKVRRLYQKLGGRQKE
jgi:signal peptidase I